MVKIQINRKVVERKYVVQVLDTVRRASKTVYNNYDIIVYSWKILDTYASLGHLSSLRSRRRKG